MEIIRCSIQLEFDIRKGEDCLAPEEVPSTIYTALSDLGYVVHEVNCIGAMAMDVNEDYVSEDDLMRVKDFSGDVLLQEWVMKEDVCLNVTLFIGPVEKCPKDLLELPVASGWYRERGVYILPVRRESCQ